MKTRFLLLATTLMAVPAVAMAQQTPGAPATSSVSSGHSADEGSGKSTSSYRSPTTGATQKGAASKGSMTSSSVVPAAPQGKSVEGSGGK